MKHLLRQNILMNGTKVKNPDYLSQSAQMAIQKKFTEVKSFYETQLSVVLRSNAEQEEQVNIYRQLTSSGASVNINDLTVDRLLAILTTVVKTLKMSDELKPFELWAEI